MSGDFEIERRCLYDKRPGIVQLSHTHLVWTPDSKADGEEVHVAFTAIRQFQVSKEGSAKKRRKQAMIRLTCSDRQNKITLDFGRDFPSRDSIRDMLNRLQTKGANAMSAQQTGTNGSTVGSGNEGQASPASIPAKLIAPEERARRQRLFGNKEVVRMHRTLVRTGAVSEEQFWNAMKYRYKNNGERRGGRGEVEEEGDAAKGRGVPSDAFATGMTAVVDVDRWEGEIPTAAQRHLVFMAHPAVAAALDAKVPKEMSEAKVWQLFRESSMGRIGRGGRKTVGRLSKLETAVAAEADAVFAGFQAREGELVARDMERRVEDLAREIDMDRFDDHRGAHVTEGHVDAGDAPRAMKQRRGMPATGGLRLMQMVNRHGTLVVDEGSGAGWAGDSVKGRPLEDLEVGEGVAFAKIGGVADPGRMEVVAKGGAEEAADVAREVAGAVEMWSGSVVRLASGVEGSAGVLQALLAKMVP